MDFRREKKRLFKFHRKSHFYCLLQESLPVFVAATISRAVSQFFEACLNLEPVLVQIGIFLIYALLIAHTIGYYVALKYSHTSNLFEYYFHLATDNAGFAWNSTLTLIIIKWLYSTQNVGFAMTAWILLVILVFLAVLVTNYFQIIVIKPDKEIKRYLTNFESEVFALAISYSLTVIIAASIYKNESTDYLSNTDDLNPTNDDSINEERNSRDWIFFSYLLVITVLLILVQRCLDSKIDGREYTSLKRLMREETEGQHDLTAFNFQRNSESPVNAVPSGRKGLLSYLLDKRNHKQIRKSIRCLIKTTLGYTVGCGWHIWSVLSFQEYFQFAGGNIIGLLVFAVLITAVVVLVLSHITVKQTIRLSEGLLSHDYLLAEQQQQQIDASTVSSNPVLERSAPSTSSAVSWKSIEEVDLHGRGSLFFIFGRLSVGWAWQEFVFAIITELEKLNKENDGVWILVLMKGATAIAVFWIGIYLHQWLMGGSHDTAEARRQSSEEERNESG